jgi:hypothetical protein
MQAVRDSLSVTIQRQSPKLVSVSDLQVEGSALSKPKNEHYDSSSLRLEPSREPSRERTVGMPDGLFQAWVLFATSENLLNVRLGFLRRVSHLH